MSSNVRIERKARKTYKRFRRNKKSIRVMAFSLASIMVLSVFSANLVSIVDLLTVGAATYDETDVYTANLTLYDYYTDANLGYGSISDGTHNRVFNTALHDAGYSSKCEDDTHSWDGQNLKYFPLYLGLQYPPNNAPGIMNDESYNYSMTANSEGNSSASGAALGLVDDILSNGVLTQGDGTVTLPYFDKEFLTAPITKLLSASSQGEFGISSTSSQTLGKVASGYKFNFIKNSEGYYEYDSTAHSTKYNSSSNTFTASTSTAYTVNDSKNNSGFFPWDVISGNCGSGKSANNYGYGAKFQIPFTMSSSGKIVNMDTGVVTTDDITFNFRGDDDVWVFIDDYLVLDVGGAHGAVAGSINFGTMTAKTEVVKSCSMYHHTGNCSVNTSGSSKNVSDILDDKLGLYDDPTKEHKITVYYIERGELESNCRITFNFQIADSISVTNKLNTSDVNDFFVNDTIEAANQEGIEYVIASNGGTSGLLSPEAGKDTDDAPVSSSYCTLTFDTGDPSYGSCSAITAKVGTRVKLPSGYSFNRSGYYLLGWSLNSDGSGTVYNSYDIVAADANTSKKFYAVWGKVPITLDEVPEPSLVYTKGTSISNTHDSNIKKGNSGTQYLFNYTEKEPSAYSAWYQSSSSQFPGINYGYTASSGVSLNGDNISIYKGYLYVIDTSGKTVNRYDITDADNLSYAGVTSSTISTWINNYVELYDALLAAKDNIIIHNSAGRDVTSEIAAYKTALDAYKTATPLSTDLEAVITALNTGVPDVSYTYSYVYGTDTTTFYVYSESTPTVTIANGTYSGLGTATVSVENFTGTLPAGAVDTATYLPENYYKVTVPKYIVETATPDVGTVKTTNIPTQVQINSVTASVKESTAVEAMTGDYPCYYTNDAAWRDITDAAESYAYSSATKILWLYSASGTPGTVTYSDPYGKLASKTVTPTLDITSYYYIEVPKTVIKTSGSTTESQSVNLSFTLNSSTITTSVSAASQTAPCYFNTGTSNGWHNLVTAVVEAPNWWSSIYLYVANTATSPLKCGTWPTTNMVMTNISGTSYHYFYVPSNSSDSHVFKSSSGTPSSNSYQSNDYTGFTSDKFYHTPSNPGGDNVKISYTVASITSSSYSTYYQYTATSKASTLKASAAALVAQATVIDDEILPDDSAANDSSVEDVQTEAETQKVSNSDKETDTQISENSAELAASGAGETEGQYGGTAGTYSYAKATNFKLHDSAFARSATGDQNFVIRQTNASETGKGEFNLMFGQTATFTYQFRRKSGLKVAQTGSSYHYAPDTTNTVLSANADKTISSANVDDDALYNRYSTKWVVKDDVKGQLIRGVYNSDGSVASQSNSYSAYPTSENGIIAKDSTAKTNAMTKSTDPALYVDNIYEAADANTGIHLTVEYENTVLTGELSITKEVTSAATREIEKYRDKQRTANPSITDDELYNPEFAFQVTFADYFGGYTDSNGVTTHSEVYTGMYYIDGTASTTYKTVNGVDNCIVLTYNDIVASKKIVIQGIPVDTKFEIVEAFAEKADADEPSFQLNTITQTIAGTADDRNATISISDQKITGKITTQTLNTSAIETASTVGQVNAGALAQYYSVDSSQDNFDVKFTNDINGAYIKIVKTINERYYGPNDEPNEILAEANKSISNFASNGITLIPGATTSANDPNGYQDGTAAEQTFIFKIREYSDSSFSDSALVNTFYETISFGSNDSSPTKSVMIQADPYKYYLVEEVEEWSWKYDLSSVTLLDDTAVSPSINAVISGKTAKIHDFGQTVTFNGQNYTHSDQVTFTNNKKTDNTEDIEGDTSVMVNIIRKAS